MNEDFPVTMITKKSCVNIILLLVINPINETTNDHNNIYTRGAVYAETESNLFQLKKLSPLPHTYTEISTDSSAQYSIKQIKVVVIQISHCSISLSNIQKKTKHLHCIKIHLWKKFCHHKYIHVNLGMWYWTEQ